LETLCWYRQYHQWYLGTGIVGSMEAGRTTTASATRERIVAAAAQLLAEGGRDAVSTRAVSVAAGVQPPALYRLFGDKRGLLDAVAGHGLSTYLHRKVREPSGDPVEDLRAGWDLHVGFGLENPALYALMYGEPRPGVAPPPAATAAADVLALHIRRIAEAGRLRVSEAHAANLVHAAGCGTTLTLIAMPEDRRDPALSHLAREAVIAAITTDAPAAPEPGPAAAAVTLRAVLPQTTALTAHERDLLGEWLDRITAET
jgi:AcrR family transcriptional regulator